MKKSNRVLTLVLTLVLIASLLAVPASADLMWPFQADWDTTPEGDGMSVTLTLSYINAGTEYASEDDGMFFREEFGFTKPVLVAAKDSVISQVVPIPAPAANEDTARCTVMLEGAGTYKLAVMQDNPHFTVGTVLEYEDELGAYSLLAVKDGMYDMPDAGLTLQLSAAEPGEYEDEIEIILQNYISLFQDTLTAYHIASIDDLRANEEAAQELLLYVEECNGILNEFGQPDLGERLKTYQSGRYYEMYQYVLSFEGVEPVVPDMSFFDDVDYDAWYGEYVNEASIMGLINGKADGLFAPNDNMTVAEAITLAVRLHALLYGIDMPEAGGSPWYQPFLDYAAEVGIPWEYTDYNAKVSREEYVHIFYAAVHEIEEPDLNSVADGAIPDVPMSHPYAEDIYAFYRVGILTGSDAKGSFQPQSSIKRCEVAAILCRIVIIDFRQEFTLG